MGVAGYGLRLGCVWYLVEKNYPVNHVLPAESKSKVVLKA